jgi:bacteriochlorophyllide a dehydrogenase
VHPTGLTSLAVVLEAPHRLAVTALTLNEPTDADVVVDIAFSGISTGTERLLWSGKMPNFPGMGYPLVPGYESVGVVRAAGSVSGRAVGDHVFVPGANCYGAVRGLFGGASQTIVVPGARVISCDPSLSEQGVLLSLAATAYHTAHPPGLPAQQPELIVGHGVLGRLQARIALALGSKAPTVWESNPARRTGATGYEVVDAADDSRRDYRSICDCSGDPAILDKLVQRLAPGGEIILAGFYSEPLSFVFPPAFMREARIRIAAQFLPADLAAVTTLITSGRLSLDGLLTHSAGARDAAAAYETAFTDSACLKMVLDWRNLS